MRDLLSKAVKQLLLTADVAQSRCSVQGFGMFRYRLDDDTRIHVWHQHWRTENVSDIHDHLQWHFTSTVLRGQIVNRIFTRGPGGQLYDAHRIVAGEGGGHDSVTGQVTLAVESAFIHNPGDSYTQFNDEIHQSLFSNGAITVIKQRRVKELKDSATVFVPAGEAWVDAKPRKAILDDFELVRDIVAGWEV